MAYGTKTSVGTGLRTLFEVGTVAGRSDGELLEIFLATGGSAADLAFATLVERHGPMVWRVCRDTLRGSNDADDAFQATFLILVRRAGAIRKRSSLGPWLHGVALRVARSARRCAIRRRDRERGDPGPEPAEFMARDDRLDEAPILHEEVDRLPAKYREPLVLCYFRGLTHDETATQLGWPVGTVRSRLAEARVRLRPRLLRRGVAPSVAILAASGKAEAAAVVPASLASATIRMAVGAGSVGTVPAAVAALVGTTLRGMTFVKTSMIAAGLLAASLVSMVGAGRVAGEAGEMAGPPGGADQAPRVSVRTVRPTTVTIKQQYAAQIHSRRRIQVRALVEGSLAPIPIKEGQAVKAGDRLFEITSPILRTRLDAELAERDLAQVDLNKTRKLAEQKAGSDEGVKLSEAKLAKAQARLDLVKAELDFATIKAPFDGTVGRLTAQAGSHIKEGDELTTLADNSVMWVYFKVSEKRYLESMDGRREGEEPLAIELTLADRRKFSHPGKLGAIEARSTNGDGTIAHRADFPNPDGILRPDQTGTVSINRVLKDAIVVPASATFEDHGKKYVYLVDNHQVARKREITVRAEVEGEFVVEAGIKLGDRIVSDGVGTVHEGDKVED